MVDFISQLLWFLGGLSALWYVRTLEKRIKLLERSDVYHHTRITNVPNECENIKEHNKTQYQVWKEEENDRTS